MWVAVEGIECSGKTFSINSISDVLNSNGINHIVVRSPGGTVLSERLRNMLLGSMKEDISETSEILLFMAAIHDSLCRVINPALEKNIWVISDRYIGSMLAYQSVYCEENYQKIIELDRLLNGGSRPDVTFFLDGKVVNCMERLLKRNRKLDRIESKGAEFLEKVRNRYLEYIRKENSSIVCIDSEGSIELLILKIQNEINNIILNNKYTSHQFKTMV